MKPLGTHLIAEFVNCPEKMLNDKKTLERTLKLGTRKCGLNLKALKCYQFNPVGITVTAILSESHIAIHTYPEARHASVDIFTCSSSSNAHKLLYFLKKRIKPKTVRIIELSRGNPLEITQKDCITSYSSHGFEIKYRIKRKIFSKKSKYQQIDIIENEDFGKMLFLDNDVQIAEKDAHIYNQGMVSPLIGKSLNRVAILGGGDGGVLNELLKYNPKNVVLVDIDKEVILASKKFLQKICKNAFMRPNVKVVIGDANKFLDKHDSFDAIVCDLTMHPESLIRKDRETFLDELFLKIKKSLQEKGMVSLQCCSEFDMETLKRLKRLLPKYFAKIVFRKYFIPSFCENWVFASAMKS